MRRFLSENLRWLATGFLLAFGSSFGQTYFIRHSPSGLSSDVMLA
jgi:predicted negative regulator of RcsB-dependent stress response